MFKEQQFERQIDQLIRLNQKVEESPLKRMRMPSHKSGSDFGHRVGGYEKVAN
jgi:hypothetical protein